MNIPFSERDLKTLLDSGHLTVGPITIVKHPDSTETGFFKVIRERFRKLKAAEEGELIYIPEMGEPDDADAYVLASEQLEAEHDGKQDREEE